MLRIDMDDLSSTKDSRPNHNWSTSISATAINLRRFCAAPNADVSLGSPGG